MTCPPPYNSLLLKFGSCGAYAPLVSLLLLPGYSLARGSDPSIYPFLANVPWGPVLGPLLTTWLHRTISTSVSAIPPTKTSNIPTTFPPIPPSLFLSLSDSRHVYAIVVDYLARKQKAREREDKIANFLYLKDRTTEQTRTKWVDFNSKAKENFLTEH